MEEKKSLLLEGLLPTDVWNAIIVILILFGVFIAVFKGVVLIRDEIRKSKEKKSLQGNTAVDQIATKVTEKINTQIDEKFDSFEQKFDQKFEEIDRKLASDKETIELHTRQLNAQNARVDQLDNDNKALLHGMSALLGHIATGNSVEKVKKANDAMKNYLIDRKYDEEDWKI